MKKKTQLEALTEKVLNFRNARQWEMFHDGKNLAMSLSIEASELLEVFLWKKGEEIDINKLEDELADVIYSALLIASAYHLDVEKIVNSKLRKNALKYPVKKFKGINKKYSEK